MSNSTARFDLSIATVVFNARDDFGRTLGSVRQQKQPDVEYIVIDGGSTDGTLALAQQAGDLIDTLVSETDSGIYDAMNKAVARCRGRALHFLNAGDVLAPGAVAVLLEAARSTNDLVCHAVRLQAPRLTSVIYPPQRPPATPDAQHMYWPHPGMVVQRQVFERIGVFDTRWRYSADLEWTHRAMRTPGLRVAYSDRAVVEFELGGASSTAASARETRDVAIRFGKPLLPAYFRYWKVRLRQWAGLIAAPPSTPAP